MKDESLTKAVKQALRKTFWRLAQCSDNLILNTKQNIMMTIHFKNGTKKQIKQETAEILKNNIIKGCADFQIFSDENDKVFLFVKVSEIILID